MKHFLNFIFEMGQLRFKPRTGWQLFGMKHPENVAEHTLRAAQLGFIIARLEQHSDPYQIAVILMFHDMAESRTGDLDNMAKKYVNRNEQKAVNDQTRDLGEIGKEIVKLWDNAHDLETKTGIIARDADLLECMFTATEYKAQGYAGMEEFTTSTYPFLKTETAKKMAYHLERQDPKDWWISINRSIDAVTTEK